MPLIRITFSWRYDKLICLGNFKRRITKHLGYRYTGFYMGSKHIFVNAELNRTMQQPVPSYRAGCLQFIINQYDVRIEHDHLTAIFGQRSFAESVFRRLFNTGFLKTFYPHRVFTDAAICMRRIPQAITDMFSSGCTQQHAVSFSGKRLSDAIYKNAVVCPCMTIRHQVMCIAKIQIISRVIIYLLPSIQQVKTVLVGQRMTSRAERTRTESETEIIFRRCQVTVHHHLTDVLIPFQFRGRSRKVRRIRPVTAHAVKAQVHIRLHNVGTSRRIPSGIPVAQFTRQEIGKGGIRTVRLLPTLAPVAETRGAGTRREVVGDGLPSRLIPRMLEKIKACGIGK